MLNEFPARISVTYYNLVHTLAKGMTKNFFSKKSPLSTSADMKPLPCIKYEIDIIIIIIIIPLYDMMGAFMIDMTDNIP